MTGESGAGDFFWPLIWRGVGLGLMFVPLTTMTLAELSPQELPQGTGLYNFFRQLGGSFGIAVMATLLTRYATQMRAVLGDHVTMSDPAIARAPRDAQARDDGARRGRVDGAAARATRCSAGSSTRRRASSRTARSTC